MRLLTLLLLALPASLAWADGDLLVGRIDERGEIEVLGKIIR